MLNSILSKSAAKVMANTSPSQFIIEARFINSEPGSKFSYYPFMIEHITINRDYIENFGDEIDISMKISPKDYALLQDQGQNLLCILTITYVNKYFNTVYTPPPIRRQYNVMINNPRDIRKAIPDVQAYTEPQTDITIRLIEPTIYRLRHTKINTVYQNLTPTQAIHAITKSFEIEKIQMVSLDNTHKYDHIEIPSYQGISSIYGYLHSKVGLYQKGATSYITNEVLYIYPPFETNPTYDKTAIFYQVATGNYAGSHIFHRTENKSISIVINSQPESYDLSIAGAENVGTGFVFTRASHMTDGFTTVNSKEGAQFTNKPALTVSLNDSRTVMKDVNNVFHIKATDNPFPAMSQIVSHQASLMEVIWQNADPFQLDPGHAISYYYDKDERMVKKTGILEKALYQFSIITKKDGKDIFGAVGQLVLRLSPNSTMVL